MGEQAREAREQKWGSSKRERARNRQQARAEMGEQQAAGGLGSVRTGGIGGLTGVTGVTGATGEVGSYPTFPLLMEKITESKIIPTLFQSVTYFHFFYIDSANNCSFCKMCLTKFKYNQQKTGTRSLKRHLDNKHPTVANAKENIK